MPSGLVEVSSNDKKFKGYVTAPANGVYPGVLLLHQQYGIEPYIRYFAELLSTIQYTVFVPDLFWRDKPGCELSSNDVNDINEANNLMKSYDMDKGLNDVTSCLKWLRETPQCNGLVTTIGFGIGGNLSYLAGLWLDIESSVCFDFYGSDFFQENDTFIRRPMLINLCDEYYKIIKDKAKEQYIENISNVNLSIYKARPNFYKLGDKDYDEENSALAIRKTVTHIKNAFNKPHST